MKFTPGTPKPPNSGRKKGTKNKKKVPKVSDFLAESDINPVERVMQIIDSGELKPIDEAQLWMDLLSYCQPKAKEVTDDYDGEEDDPLDELTDEQLLRLVKSDDEVS